MIEKIINGGNYQPTLTDKIVLDSTPTVNSLNGVTSDAVARAIAGASGEVPQVTENDNGKILTAIYDAGGPAVEWGEAPSSTVSTSGVISGDGSAADPVVLNVGAGLSSGSSSEWGESSSISKLANKGLTVPAAVAVDILTNNKNVQLTLPNDDGEWDIQDTQGGNYALALCYGSGNSWTVGVVFAPNYTDRWNNGYAYLSGFHGTKTVELDMSNLISNIDSGATDADRRAALLSSAQENNDVLLTFARYFNDGQGYYRYYTDTSNADNYISYSNMSYKLGVPGSAALSVTNPVPAYAAGDAGKVLKVNAGGTGVEWAAQSGGSSNVEIIPLSSTTASALDTFAAAVHTAYAAGKVVVAKLVNANYSNVYTMYLPMTQAYEGETIQYYFGGQAMYYDDGATLFKPEEYYMYVYNYGDPHYSAEFAKARPTGLSWSPFAT